MSGRAIKSAGVFFVAMCALVFAAMAGSCGGGGLNSASTSPAGANGVVDCPAAVSSFTLIGPWREATGRVGLDSSQARLQSLSLRWRESDQVTRVVLEANLPDGLVVVLSAPDVVGSTVTMDVAASRGNPDASSGGVSIDDLVGALEKVGLDGLGSAGSSTTDIATEFELDNDPRLLGTAGSIMTSQWGSQPDHLYVLSTDGLTPLSGGETVSSIHATGGLFLWRVARDPQSTDDANTTQTGENIGAPAAYLFVR